MPPALALLSWVRCPSDIRTTSTTRCRRRPPRSFTTTTEPEAAQCLRLWPSSPGFGVRATYEPPRRRGAEDVGRGPSPPPQSRRPPDASGSAPRLLRALPEPHASHLDAGVPHTSAELLHRHHSAAGRPAPAALALLSWVRDTRTASTTRCRRRPPRSFTTTTEPEAARCLRLWGPP